MPCKLPAAVHESADRQRGLITRRQALAAGLSGDLIDSWLKQRRWQRLHTGVYATFSGVPDREATLWGAILRAGRGAALTCETAAELDGLLAKPAAVIHVAVPATRRVTKRASDPR